MEHRHQRALVLMLSSLAAAPNVVAAPGEDVESVFGSGEVLSLATGYGVPIRRAPATATVLTREDLDAFGARTLKDALNLVPGFHVATADGRSTFSTVRGITSRVLVLIDGIPITRTMIDPWVGFDNVLLYNVSRIEVVRGPGSAIYGADAVAGVINIETKTAAHGDRQEVGAGVGWNNTYDAWSILSGDFGGLELSGYAAFSKTDGSSQTVEVDAQTMIDQALRTTASLAPAEMPQRRESVDVRLDARLGDFTARLAYYDQNPLQNGVGVAYALDLDGEWNSLLKVAQLNYHSDVSDDLKIDAYVDFSEVEQDAYANVFPPGAFGNAFPDGVISSFLIENQRWRIESTVLYTGFETHTLRAGGGYLDNAFETVRDVRNYVVRNARFIPTGQLAPFGGVGDAPLIGDTDADTVFAYVQDQWQFASDWTLTSGVRWDRYSDFGSTVNPRLGLVWNARHNLSAKALVGRAFRPPSILELQSSGVFSARGNPSLNPTTMDMAELGLSLYETAYEADLTFFRYQQQDLIQVIPDPTSPSRTAYVNRGENDGWGYEASFSYRPIETLRTSLSYAYQDRLGSAADDNANIRFAPHHVLVATIDWRLPQEWRVALTARGVMDRERPISDPRPDPDDYLVVNSILARANAFSLFDLALVVNNVFDEDVRDASPSATTLPFDIPLPGRTWMVNATARW
jgi:outer membrane receptor for ferrienterochelin and colicins